MKKRILILITILLLTTGCTCEYNLTIKENTYKEEIIITGETKEEISNFNNKWQIPISKEEYNKISLESDTNGEYTGEIYNYNLSNNRLTFKYDFSKNQYINSTAVSNCYDMLTITNSNNRTIISTSSNTKCFENHPPLNNIKINIKVDKPVISNNADRINGNTYTWNIDKSNANEKSINLIIDNQTNDNENNIQSTPNNNNINNNKTMLDSYAIYIFLAILALIIYFGYKWFINMKDKNNDID